jgi:F0F1-type ATP synthase assembly protein I
MRLWWIECWTIESCGNNWSHGERWTSILCTKCSINSAKGLREITNSLDSSPIISTTTRPLLARSMGNSLGTKTFKSGSLSKCEEQRVALEAHDQSLPADWPLVSKAAHMRPPERQTELLSFRLGDYLAGILTGVLTALAVRLIVGSTWAMVMAMLLGMAVGHQMTGGIEATGQDRFIWKE